MVILVTSVMQPIDTPTAPTAIRATTLDIVIPVYNEEHDLEPCVRRLHAFLADEVPYSARITIADNASTDSTLKIAHRLSRELVGVDVLHLEEKGRGRALAAAWLSSDAEVVAYCDVDLSTDLNALMPLVAPLISGHLMSRTARGSTATRGWCAAPSASSSRAPTT